MSTGGDTVPAASATEVSHETILGIPVSKGKYFKALKFTQNKAKRSR